MFGENVCQLIFLYFSVDFVIDHQYGCQTTTSHTPHRLDGEDPIVSGRVYSRTQESLQFVEQILPPLQVAGSAETDRDLVFPGLTEFEEVVKGDYPIDFGQRHIQFFTQLDGHRSGYVPVLFLDFVENHNEVPRSVPPFRNELLKSCGELYRFCSGSHVISSFPSGNSLEGFYSKSIKKSIVGTTYCKISHLELLYLRYCESRYIRMVKNLNKSTILRLARYLRVLQKLKSLGFVKVFSNNLGDAIGVTPAVVRKDFSIINIPGNKRGGYNIDTLIELLSNVLGKNQPHEIIIVGCGRIGSALMEYKEFGKEGIHIAAGFDIDPQKVESRAGIPILDVKDMPGFIKEHKITVGVIAVPDSAAAQVMEQMVSAGIQGILNFAPVELKCNHKGCLIHNVNLSLEIENLFYLVKLADRLSEPFELL
jgi:redox-sensing transcriptional repressor